MPAQTQQISIQSLISAFGSNRLTLHPHNQFVHVWQLWRLRTAPCSWGKVFLLFFSEGNNTLQLMLRSLSFLARISGWAGIPHFQHQASVIQLCSKIQNYKLSPSALEVPALYILSETSSLLMEWFPSLQYSSASPFLWVQCLPPRSSSLAVSSDDADR